MEKQDTEEYKILNKLTPSLRIGDCAGGHRIENRGKNRNVMVVPPDHSRPYLNTLHGESKDYTYINAVFVDGYTRKNEWIVTEWPKTATIDSFWTLIFDHFVHTVVNLSNQGSAKTYPKFIHDKGKHVYGPFVVEVVNLQQYPTATVHTVKVMKRWADEGYAHLFKHHKGLGQQHEQLTFMISEIMQSGAAFHGQNADDVRMCCVIQVKMWPIENNVPLSTSGLVDVIKMVRSWRRRAPDRPETKPTVVMSHNGVSRCGIFIGANHCVDQMDIDGEIDVFHTVKMIRVNRPPVIDTKDEYKYLYDLMLHWYMMNPEYRTRGQATAPGATPAATTAALTPAAAMPNAVSPQPPAAGSAVNAASGVRQPLQATHSLPPIMQNTTAPPGQAQLRPQYNQAQGNFAGQQQPARPTGPLLQAPGGQWSGQWTGQMQQQIADPQQANMQHAAMMQQQHNQLQWQQHQAQQQYNNMPQIRPQQNRPQQYSIAQQIRPQYQQQQPQQQYANAQQIRPQYPQQQYANAQQPQPQQGGKMPHSVMQQHQERMGQLTVTAGQQAPGHMHNHT